MGRWIVHLLLLAVAFGAPAQERFETGELKGFTKSPTEHIIERLEQTRAIRNVEGSVRANAPKKPLEGVLIEIRGPGVAEKIRSTVSNRQGRFRLGGVPDGDYTIKVTLNGFRSVVGTISVRRSAEKSKPLRIDLLPGA
jgi:carboxypeptidase family protein